jgi:hypothetical protein
VEPLFWKGFEGNMPDWLHTIKPNGRTIYLTFGGTGYDSEKLIKLSTSLVNLGFRVLVSASHIASVTSFPKHKDLYVEKYLPGLEVSRRVDLVVCHGGYGTMMQAVLSGKPVVAIPFNPDQLIHAYRFQELGLAKSVVKIIPRMWLNFQWSTFGNLGKTTSIPSIIEAVSTIFNKYEFYQTSIQKFIRTVPTDGVKRAAEIVEAL